MHASLRLQLISDIPIFLLPLLISYSRLVSELFSSCWVMRHNHCFGDATTWYINIDTARTIRWQHWLNKRKEVRFADNGSTTTKSGIKSVLGIVAFSHYKLNSTPAAVQTCKMMMKTRAESPMVTLSRLEPRECTGSEESVPEMQKAS
jgi:hypothetical protein